MDILASLSPQNALEVRNTKGHSNTAFDLR